ncbi:MAG: hypothetical protein LKF37_10090 [Lentilactobacillus diolivorans]|jgi:hypothetical protein|nr:hypothetical protein [Lentilactobacillus diolivorans]
MKIKNILVTTVATLVFVPALGNATQAATWKRYTPAVLRGHWKALHKIPAMGGHLRPYCIVKKDYFNAGAFSDPALNNKVQYRHKTDSQIYYIKCHEIVYSHEKQVNYYKFILHNSNKSGKKYMLKFKFLGARIPQYKHNKFTSYKEGYGKWLYR